MNGNEQSREGRDEVGRRKGRENRTGNLRQTEHNRLTKYMSA